MSEYVFNALIGARCLAKTHRGTGFAGPLVRSPLPGGKLRQQRRGVSLEVAPFDATNWP